MQVRFIQQSLLEASTFISHGKVAEASQMIVGLLRVLQTTKMEPRQQQQSGLQQLRFAPISHRQLKCPDWKDEFFRFPFVVLGSSTADLSSPHRKPLMVTEPIAASFAGVCFFLLGLCHHINSTQNKMQCPEASVRSAMSFYEQAWRILVEVEDDSKGGLEFLQMAICTNLSNCCFKLGEIESANEWQAELNEILYDYTLKDDDLTLELHDFFMMTSACSTGFVAAGAA